jgi:hypothetical protein
MPRAALESHNGAGMILALLIAAVAIPHATTDTTVIFAKSERDLTGDGIPEVLSLTGVGKTVDDLTVTFEIQSAGRTSTHGAGGRFQMWSFGLVSASSAIRSSRTPSSCHRKASCPGSAAPPACTFPLIPEVISQEMTPRDSSRARRIWEQMQAAGIPVFHFSLGGDRITVIGWSTTDQRFYGLLECC